MSSLFKQFKVDPSKESEGVVVTFAPNDDSTVPTFRILHISGSNQRYVKVLERESAPYRRLMDMNILDPKIQRSIMMRVFCTAILVGWDHVQGEKGESIAFSFENAMTLFTQLPELYYELADRAGKLSSFRAETADADAKNS